MFLVHRVLYCLVFIVFLPAGLPWRNEADLSQSYILVSIGRGSLDLFVFFRANSTVKSLVTSLKLMSIKPSSENYCLELSLFQYFLHKVYCVTSQQFCTHCCENLKPHSTFSALISLFTVIRSSPYSLFFKGLPYTISWCRECL